jgi:hypothetical protein
MPVCGFAGIVNYDADFLYEVQEVTKILYKMAEELKWGIRHGIEVIEPHGAFAQNSCTPLRGADYCFRQENRLAYLFGADTDNGACFIPSENKLFLFRRKTGSPVYYNEIEGTGLVFSSSANVLKLFGSHGEYKILEPGKALIYAS